MDIKDIISDLIKNAQRLEAAGYLEESDKTLAIANGLEATHFRRMYKAIKNLSTIDNIN